MTSSLFKQAWSTIRRRLQQHRDPIRLLERLYARIDGGYIAQAERERWQLHDTSFTYGEVVLSSLQALLVIAEPLAGETFYDLGSGTGKVVLGAACFYPWAHCVGVEYLPGLYQVSQVVLQNLYNLLAKQRLPARQMAPVTFVEADFLTVDLVAASVILVHATTLNPVLWEKLVTKLQQLPAGVRLIIASKKLPAEGFQSLHQGFYAMSWGKCLVTVYRKIG